MGFKFNPFTGQFDIVGAGGTATDPNILSFVAGTGISALRAVKLNASSELIYADKDTYENSQAIGLSITSGIVGDTIQVQTFGVLQDASFSFTLDGDIYLSSGGILTQSAPVSGVVLKLGKAIKTDTILIDIEMAVILA